MWKKQQKGLKRARKILRRKRKKQKLEQKGKP